VVLLHEEEQQPNGRKKERQDPEGAQEPQKAHPTSKFAIYKWWLFWFLGLQLWFDE